mmetsp:Transcript_1520/g.4401  ORF Transcript_1520/g.4401 Transcript_1520/m.4401 type:complete len:403 (-) Transcript_1520:107-1315(-)
MASSGKVNGTATAAVAGGGGGGMISVRAVILLLALTNLLVYQFATLKKSGAASDLLNVASRSIGIATPTTATAGGSETGSIRGTASSASASRHALEIPQGEAVALPSVRISEEETAKVNRKIYGGAGDKKHLGGFTEIDIHGIAPTVWEDMVQYFGIKSIIDVGCGRGISTSWFVTHGLDTLCAEGSHDAVERTMLPDPSVITEHDFSRGPWWPSRTLDAVWSVEFLEHVGRNYHQNYIPIFRKAAFIFVTSSRWGGWHHVEVHPDEWWIEKYRSYGFIFSESLTKRVRSKALQDKQISFPLGEVPGQGTNFNPQHVYTSMKVFINPAVASLPEHQHLFAEHGCYVDRTKEGKIVNRVCGEGRHGGMESVLPQEHMPLELTEEQDKAWVDILKANINLTASK